ncbi:MAG: NfeD family protein [Ruminococcus sp.]|nr:NfeD family protein [Ruminococcus sp.]
MIDTSAWWAGLSVFEQVLYCIAAGSSVVLILQFIMMFAGGFSEIGGEGGAINPSDTSGIDADLADIDGADLADGADLPDGTDMPIGADGTVSTLKLFTFQGILAFLASFSWITIACLSGGFGSISALFIGVGVGILMMFAVAKLIQLLMKLSDDGTVDFENAVGIHATVYIPVPGDLAGEGKVIAEFQGAERECSAITAQKETIPTNTEVIVTSVKGNTLVVERI